MYSFEGDFRRKPSQALGGIQKKVSTVFYFSPNPMSYAYGNPLSAVRSSSTQWPLSD